MGGEQDWSGWKVDALVQLLGSEPDSFFNITLPGMQDLNERPRELLFIEHLNTAFGTVFCLFARGAFFLLREALFDRRRGLLPYNNGQLHDPLRAGWMRSRTFFNQAASCRFISSAIYKEGTRNCRG